MDPLCGEWKAVFSLIAHRLYDGMSGSPDYGDKRWRELGAADPGAVPGGSTTTPWATKGALTGPNQDRRVLNGAVFCSEWDHRNGP